MFGSNNGIVIAFLVLDMIVTIGVVFFFLSRRNSRGNGGAKSNPGGDFNNAPPSPFESPFSSSTASDGDDIDVIKDLLRQGQKIPAIKFYRECTGAGLKDAKDAVEEIERQMR